jgi:hypothetical protein
VLEVGQSRKKGDFGKEFMHNGRDRWKKEQHMRIHGRPNDIRVRVFATYCNGWQAINEKI